MEVQVPRLRVEVPRLRQVRLLERSWLLVEVLQVQVPRLRQVRVQHIGALTPWLCASAVGLQECDHATETVLETMVIETMR